MKKLFATALVFIMVVGIASLGTAETMRVVTTHPDESIFMYTKPDYEAGSRIIPIPSGAQVTVRTIMADVPWAEVSYGGYTGYVALESLKEQDVGTSWEPVPSGPVIKTMYVTSHNGGGVHMRFTPSINDDNIIMTVPYGAQVNVMTIMADVPYAAIEYNGQTGYMMLDYLSNHQPSPVSSAPSTNSGSHSETALEAMFDGFMKGGYNAVVTPAQGETYVNMRWAPSLSAPVRTEYNANAVLWVSTLNDTWSEVYDEALDIHGYMESVFLKVQ